ncbi:MAG: TIGR00730 family Rossman fold protein [Planctomycetaceae bacterium]
MEPPTRAMPPERSLWYREEEDIDRSLAFIHDEFRAGFELVAGIDRPAVSVFGSARVRPDDERYERTRALGAAIAGIGWAVVTGGGPGLMEAANRGAKEAGGLSVGLGIRLPREESLNPWCDLSYDFKHFYARKVCFVKASEGFIAAPGGWGTCDELYEALVLIQTHKIEHFPVVLFGDGAWDPFLAWSERMVGQGLVSAQDVRLVSTTDDPDEAVELILRCYRRECEHLA